METPKCIHCEYAKTPQELNKPCIHRRRQIDRLDIYKNLLQMKGYYYCQYSNNNQITGEQLTKYTSRYVGCEGYVYWDGNGWYSDENKQICLNEHSVALIASPVNQRIKKRLAKGVLLARASMDVINSNMDNLNDNIQKLKSAVSEFSGNGK